MENNYAKQIVEARIQKLKYDRMVIDDEIEKLEMKNKNSLMKIRQSIIFDNWESKYKTRMGILKTRERANNYAYAQRTNKLLKLFDDYYMITKFDIDGHNQKSHISNKAYLYNVEVQDYIDKNKEYFDKIIFI